MPTARTRIEVHAHQVSDMYFVCFVLSQMRQAVANDRENGGEEEDATVCANICGAARRAPPDGDVPGLGLVPLLMEVGKLFGSRLPDGRFLLRMQSSVFFLSNSMCSCVALLFFLKRY